MATLGTWQTQFHKALLWQVRLCYNGPYKLSLLIGMMKKRNRQQNPKKGKANEQQLFLETRNENIMSSRKPKLLRLR
jgi:hypothetical protein